MEGTPEWLVPLVQAKFATSKGSNPSQNNLGFFCLDCMGNPLSKIELSNHADHDHIQVKKSSQEYAVKIADMVKRGLNCDKIHPFVINHDDIFYLRSRKSPSLDNVRVSVQNGTGCKVCNHALSKGSEYCSLACKFKIGTGRGTKEKAMENGERKVEGMVGRPNKRRRKGIPRRGLSPTVIREFPDSEIFHDGGCDLCKARIAPKRRY